LNVEIDWTAPSDNGSPIDSYMIYIQQSDLSTYSVESTNCNGALNAAVISETKCFVPINILRSSVYQLPWGSSVYAYVVAFNKYGASA